MSASFAALSDELVLQIFEQVHGMAPRSLLDLCPVSSQFCRIAASIIYRHVYVPSGNFWALNSLPESSAWYSFQSNLEAHTRYITVNCPLNWKLFARLISRMQQLDSLSWDLSNQPFPALVAEVLNEKWPNAKLFIEALPMRGDDPTLDDEGEDLLNRRTLNSLLGCGNIYSINAFTDCNFPGQMRRLKEIILSCKRLEVLHLRLWRNEDGRLPTSQAESSEFDLCVESGDKLPPLKELAIDSKIFTPTSPTTVSIPSTFWNWSQIRHLELRGQNMLFFLESIRGQILHLDTLIIEHFFYEAGYDGDADRVLEDFIISIHGLKNLKLINPTKQISISTFAHHGSTLERLTVLHPRKTVLLYSGYTNACPYEPADLEYLRESCPRLRSLALDMEVCSELPYDFLAALARFPKLERIRIHFRLERLERHLRRTNRLPHFQTDILTVRHIYSFIRSQRMNRPFRLTVIIGQYPRFLRTVPSFNLLTRPIVHFTCLNDEDGNVIVQHDTLQHEYSGWAENYFDEGRLKKIPGVTYPSNLEELMAAEEEANQTMQGVGDAHFGDEVDSLFGSP